MAIVTTQSTNPAILSGQLDPFVDTLQSEITLLQNEANALLIRLANGTVTGVSDTTINLWWFGGYGTIQGSGFNALMSSGATAVLSSITLRDTNSYNRPLFVFDMSGSGTVDSSGNIAGTITQARLSDSVATVRYSGNIPLAGGPGFYNSITYSIKAGDGSVSKLVIGGALYDNDSGTIGGTVSSLAFSTDPDGDGPLSFAPGITISGLSVAFSTLAAVTDPITLVNSLLSGNDTIYGTAGSDDLAGYGGNDTLDGKAGADTLSGGLGNDTYIVNNAGDIVIENPGEGTDLVKIITTTPGTYSLTANVENGFLFNTVAFNLTGNDLANTLIGNDLANTLDGGLGSDVLRGGLGNDTYGVDDAGDVLVDTGGVDTVLASLTWSLAAGFENLTLTGSADADGTGNSLANTLAGNDGINILTGGAGNDTYVVGAGDVIVESSTLSAEIDSVLSSVSWSLAATLENLTLTGSVDIDGTGNDLANTLMGNDGINTLAGGLGNDTYFVGSGDIIVETSTLATEIDTVRSSVSWSLGANVEKLVLTGLGNVDGTGNSLSNTLIGNDSANTLDGGVGADSMSGGLGNDTYVVDEAGDVLADAGGIDTVLASLSWSLAAGFENLTLGGSANLNGKGNNLDNTLTGNDGINSLSGGLGNDTYVVGTGDVLADTGGIDTVRSALSWSLAAGFENLVLTGSADLNGSGNGLANSLTGNDGSNTLIGGLGNDTYEVGAGDVIVESSALATEIDSVRSSVSWSLGANLENLTLIGSANLDATGNGLANVLVGNSGNNTLDGGLAIDVLKGAAGDDTYWIDLTAANLLQDGIVENLNEGSDAVILRGGNAALATYTALTLGANVESLDASGTTTAKLNLTGNGLANTLIGNAADNVLNGGGGADFLVGGLGNDTYVVDSLADVVSENPGEGTDLVKVVAAGSGTYSLAAHVEKAVLLNAVAFNLTGNAEANTLTGNDFANTLDGGLGADFLSGGLGNDTYVVDEAGDVLADTGGVDTVRSALSWSLAAGFENLVLTGSADLNGSGNGLANSLTGNDGANTLIGGLGNDTYEVGAGDVIVESSALATEIDSVRSSVSWSLGANLENLTLIGSANLDATGNGLANVLVGNSGNNTLDGGLAIDVLKGAAGDDTYLIDLTAANLLQDGIVENLNEGSDAVILRGGNAALATYTALTLGANVESLDASGTTTAKLNLTGNGLANTLIGNAADNVLNGGGGNDFLVGGLGNDTLDGGAGEDTLAGGLGDDTYVVGSGFAEVVLENAGEGTDLVKVDTYSSFYNLPDNVENAILINTLGFFLLTGNDLANILIGNALDNTLDGGLGADFLSGGLGNDTYVVDDVGDVLADASGIDTVRSALSWSLAAGFENLTLTGFANLDATGNDLANTLFGNFGANTLAGGAGNDELDGYYGSDSLIGGAGNDVLTGGDGNDAFVFSSPLNSSNNVDWVKDFSVGDRLVLDDAIFAALGASVTADEFLAGAGNTTAATADQHLIYNTNTGALYYDSDGAGGAAATQFATVSYFSAPYLHPSLSVTDFLVA